MIRKREDRYLHLYDEDKVIMLSDARRRPSIDLMPNGQVMDVGNPAVSEINILNFNEFYGNGSAEYPYPQIKVEAGKCYRFRFIQSAGNAQSLQIKIAGHVMTMIALDGLDIHPINVTGFNIHGGERMDAIFCADQEPGNYIMNATYDLDCDLAKDGVGFNATDQAPVVPLLQLVFPMQLTSHCNPGLAPHKDWHDQKSYVISCEANIVIDYSYGDQSPANANVGGGTLFGETLSAKCGHPPGRQHANHPGASLKVLHEKEPYTCDGGYTVTGTAKGPSP